MKPSLSVWGGVECTVNRVGDTWFNQLALSGHQSRLSDLDLIAELGIRTLRFPLLWEQTVDPSGRLNWEWADRWLTRMRELGIRPIVGLLHHGSGPKFTHLLDEHFAEHFARFAAEVAMRFPWVTDYTPINEPLTTARFSTLYGLWYPHRRDDASFCRALLNQCRGIVLAMCAIRKVNPGARLIQTEDLGTTYSTDHMAYQRDFDNQRRWLTWDLLSGRVDREHPLTPFFLGNSCQWQELEWFVQNPCLPDVIGINHYVTSDRFLDQRIERYPAESVGSNSLDTYVDVPAVRVLSGGYRGWRIIQEAWQTYGAPLALTEVHLGCTRDEQLRWFQDAWNAADAARQGGCDIVGITSWALFGSFNWDQLLTRDSGSYEVGAFDCRSSPPRPTGIAHLLRRLCVHAKGMHASMSTQGWWQRENKLTYPLDGSRKNDADTGAAVVAPVALLIGEDSPRRRAIARACGRRNLVFKIATSRITPTSDDGSLDILFVQHTRVWAIIDTRIEARPSAGAHVGCSYRSVVRLTDLCPGVGGDSIVIDVAMEETAYLSSASWEQLADASLDLLIDEAGGAYVFVVGDPELRPMPPAVASVQRTIARAPVHRVQSVPI